MALSTFINPLAGGLSTTKTQIADAKSQALVDMALDTESYTPSDITAVSDAFDGLDTSLDDFKVHTDRLSGASGPLAQPNLKTIAETVKAYSGQDTSCAFMDDAFGSLRQGEEMIVTTGIAILATAALIDAGPAAVVSHLNGLAQAFIDRAVADAAAFAVAQVVVLERAFEAAIDSLSDDPCVGDIISKVRLK